MKQQKPLPPITKLKEYLSYAPTTGVIQWVKSPANRVKDNDKVGCKAKNGYLKFEFKGKQLYCHRVAFALHYGHWPNNQIDHINGIRDDNRILNLRECSSMENSRNSKAPTTNKSGIKGVTRHKDTSKWCAFIHHNRKKYHLGIFDNYDDAKFAVMESRELFHGEFARHY